MDRNLNGYIIWEISGDLMPDLSTPLLDATNNRLNKPNVRCDPTVPNDQVVIIGSTRTPTPLPSMMEGQKPTLMPTAFTRKPTNSTSSPTLNDAVTTIIPKDEDIIFGRGAKRRHNPGNIRLRELVDEYNLFEVNNSSISELIVNIVQSATPPSRFLRYNPVTSQWEELGDKRAVERVSQMSLMLDWQQVHYH